MVVDFTLMLMSLQTTHTLLCGIIAFNLRSSNSRHAAAYTPRAKRAIFQPLKKLIQAPATHKGSVLRFATSPSLSISIQQAKSVPFFFAD
jgi:hypothetical protein